MKYLIVALGNPGIGYDNTRHNIGFKILDRLVSKFESSFSSERHAESSRLTIKGKKIIVIKPTTFMNRSGKAVNFWMQKEKILQENILVVSDDIALPFQSIRLKKKGSDGGHNGLKDIIYSLGSTEFSRIKFGSGSNFIQGYQSNYVLGEWTEEEDEFLNSGIETVIEMIESFIFTGPEKTMNNFNRK